MDQVKLQEIQTELIERLRWIANLDPGAWVEPDGKLKVPFNQLPREVAYCIRSITQKNTKAGTVVKVKFQNSKQALKLLKKLGLDV